MGFLLVTSAKGDGDAPWDHVLACRLGIDEADRWKKGAPRRCNVELSIRFRDDNPIQQHTSINVEHAHEAKRKAEAWVKAVLAQPKFIGGKREHIVLRNNLWNDLM